MEPTPAMAVDPTFPELVPADKQVPLRLPLSAGHFPKFHPDSPRHLHRFRRHPKVEEGQGNASSSWVGSAS